MNMLQRRPAPAITLQLLACLVMVVLPHTPHLHPWIWFCFGALTCWRAMAALRHWSMPARWLRLLLALLVFVGVYVTYGRINGQQGGIALLVALLAIKLTETDTLRDHIVAALLAYFVLISQFLFSQELIMVLWLAAGAWLVTATLLSLSHPQSALPYKVSIRHSAMLLLQAAPLMLVFFILFPRIPGPLWGLPSDSGAARSGLTDSMSPGDIGHLVTTDEIAFRVTYAGNAPPPDRSYWRGPVFESFDGRTWRQSADYVTGNVAGLSSRALEPMGTGVEYEVTLEPNRQKWLFTLDMPVQVPADARISRAGFVLAKKEVTERRLYAASSVLNYRLQSALPESERQRNLQLPAQRNPRTRNQAQAWRSQGLTDQQIVNKALQRFRQEPFTYTLQPPTLGIDSIDEFLFDTQRGFCEHFASSFAYQMRAAGIPARIVTGYQGGEFNELGGYYILRQSDAHAWTEVWLQGQGWLRIDPTAAVAPDRIELGLSAALPLGESMATALARRTQEGLWRSLRLRWDWVNNSWYRWVLAYGPELQEEILGRFGIRGWGNMILALTIMGSAFLGALGLVLIWRLQRSRVNDPVQNLWLLFCRKMQRQGLARAPHEGPLDYAERLSAHLPAKARTIRRIARLYIRLRYGHATTDPDERALREFRQAVRAFSAG